MRADRARCAMVCVPGKDLRVPDREEMQEQGLILESPRGSGCMIGVKKTFHDCHEILRA